MKKKIVQQAFPIIAGSDDTVLDYGLDLRDYFAAKAMQALIDSNYTGNPSDKVGAAYIYADLMINERAK